MIIKYGQLKDVWRSIKRFFINTYKFRKELTNAYPWDYQGSLLLLRRSIQDMYDFQSTVNYFVSVNRDKHCLHMKKAIKVLDRIIADEYYYTNTNFRGTDAVKFQDLPTLEMTRKHSRSIREEDLKFIAKFIERHLQHCWH